MELKRTVPDEGVLTVAHDDDTRWCKSETADAEKSSGGPDVKPSKSAAMVRNVVGVKVGVVRVGIPPQLRPSNCKYKTKGVKIVNKTLQVLY